MSNRGEILGAVVRKKHKNLTDLAAKMGYDRATLYRHFADPYLSDGIILKYAKVLKYDFIKEFPELGTYTNQLAEPLAEYRPLTLADALKEVDFWKTKYITLLEVHNELLKSMIPANQ